MTIVNFRTILGDVAGLPEVQKYLTGNLSRSASLDNLAYALDQASRDNFWDPKLGPLLMMGRYAFDKIYPNYESNRHRGRNSISEENQQTKKPETYKALNGF